MDPLLKLRSCSNYKPKSKHCGPTLQPQQLLPLLLLLLLPPLLPLQDLLKARRLPLYLPLPLHWQILPFSFT
jgi:hypothetical protein